jgi:hypothetical protein
VMHSKQGQWGSRWHGDQCPCHPSLIYSYGLSEAAFPWYLIVLRTQLPWVWILQAQPDTESRWEDLLHTPLPLTLSVTDLALCLTYLWISFLLFYFLFLLSYFQWHSLFLHIFPPFFILFLLYYYIKSL